VAIHSRGVASPPLLIDGSRKLSDSISSNDEARPNMTATTLKNTAPLDFYKNIVPINIVESSTIAAAART